MTSDLEAVTYDGLPASAGGAHSLRSKNPHTAYGKIRQFADATVLLGSAPEMTFQLWSGGPPDAAGRFESFAGQHLGGPRSRQRTHAEWRVAAENVDGVLDALSEADSRAVTSHGHPLASLVWNAEVALTEPATRAPYDGIDAGAFGGFTVDGYGRLLGASGMRATIGTTASSLSLWLTFPGDGRLHDAAAHVQDHLPFRMSAKHWRRWRATRNGQSYRATRIASPLV